MRKEKSCRPPARIRGAMSSSFVRSGQEGGRTSTARNAVEPLSATTAAWRAALTTTTVKLSKCAPASLRTCGQAPRIPWRALGRLRRRSSERGRPSPKCAGWPASYPNTKVNLQKTCLTCLKLLNHLCAQLLRRPSPATSASVSGRQAVDGAAYRASRSGDHQQAAGTPKATASTCNRQRYDKPSNIGADEVSGSLYINCEPTTSD